MIYIVTIIFKNGKTENFTVTKDSFSEFSCFLILVVDAFEKDYNSKLSNVVISCCENEEE